MFIYREIIFIIGAYCSYVAGWEQWCFDENWSWWRR